MANTFKRRTQKNIGTTLTLIGGYTAPSQTAVIGLTVCNVSAGAITCNVAFANSTANTLIAANVPIPFGSSFVPIGGDQKIVLQTGDGIKVCSNAATSIHATMCFLEIS